MSRNSLGLGLDRVGGSNGGGGIPANGLTLGGQGLTLSGQQLTLG